MYNYQAGTGTQPSHACSDSWKGGREGGRVTGLDQSGILGHMTVCPLLSPPTTYCPSAGYEDDS